MPLLHKIRRSGKRTQVTFPRQHGESYGTMDIEITPLEPISPHRETKGDEEDNGEETPVNKKLVALSIGVAVLLLLGGIQTSFLYGTQFLNSKSEYNFSVAATSAWWDCNWSYAKKITIDHTKVQADETNFPVLLYEASDADLAAYAQENGNDIVFVDRWNVTQYHHELEKFDGDTGELWAWVNVTSLSSTRDTVLYMYYGNPDCGSQQQVPGTWDAGFAMVQHLAETSGSYDDATSHGNDGNLVGGVTRGVIGKIDGAVGLDGTTGSIDMETSSSLNITSQITLEGWVQDPPMKPSGIRQHTQVHILDKRNETISLHHFSHFTVGRTISANNDSEILIALLIAPDLSITNITIANRSVLGGSYCARMPRSPEEQRIEQIRHDLPSRLSTLQTVVYSTIFPIQKGTAVPFQVYGIVQNDSFLTSRISYLVISTDGGFDFEGTTHLHCNLDLFGWLHPLSFFKNKPDFPFRKNPDKASSINRIKTEPYTTNYFKAPKNSFGVNDGYTKEVNWSSFWNFINMNAVWGLQRSLDGNTWDWANESLVETKHRSEDNTFEKSTLNITVHKNWCYRVVYKINHELQSYYNNSENCQYLLNFSVKTNETYKTFFDWSDLKNLTGFMISPSVQNNHFQFIMQSSGKISTSMDGEIITIDPTFGDTAMESSSFQIDNRIVGYLASPATSGKALYINASLYYTSAGGPWNIKCALYDSSGNFIASTEEKNLALTSSATWYRFNFSSPYPSVTASATYNISVWASDPAGTAGISYFSSGAPPGPGSARWKDTVYGSWPNPLTGETSTIDRISIFCKYTRSPSQSGPNPANSSTGERVQPQCSITVSDPDADLMTVQWYENSTGSWVLRQTNSSCANGTYRWTFTQASASNHAYYWRVNVLDSAYNVSSWYKFITDGTPPTSSVDAISPYWKKTAATITATASDAQSGVKNVTLWYRFSSNNVSWGGWVSMGVDSASPWSWSFLFSNGSGYYQFYSIARDNATNTESAPGSADAQCGYDNLAPSSNVNAISPYWKTSSPQTLTGTASDTLYERYNTGDDGGWGGGGTLWKCQTFTVGNTGNNVTHYIASVKLKLFRTGSPGMMTVGIRATNATGYPTGSDLTNGTINGDTLTTDSQGLWYQINFTAPYLLSQGTKYAIVVRAPNAAVNNQFTWRFDSTSPTYSGGSYINGQNSGTIWGINLGLDLMFEEYSIQLSGLKNVTLWYRYRATNSSSWGGWVNSGLVDTDPWVAVSWSFPFSNGTGHYQFYSIARDNATNIESLPGSSDASCGYDTVAPTSSVNAISPYWHKTSPLIIITTASDGLSGVKNVTLWYRFSTDNTSWGGWVSAGVVSGWPWSWSFSFSNGSGYYQFYSIARDNAMNVESAPGSADTKCGYDITAPSSSVNSITPYRTKSPKTITATASDALSGVKNVTLYYRFSSDNVSWGGWVSAGVVSASPWNWGFSFSNGSGYYQFYSIARDNATNVESAPGSADAWCWCDNEKPSSSVNTISPYMVYSSPLTINATASDLHSSITNVTLWYRYSTDNSTWGTGWYNTNWMYRKKLTIDHSKVTATLSNFPVLVSLTDANLSAKAQSNGNDILFTSSTGTKLNHEIESYTSATGTLVAWVNVTSVSSTADTVIYMYYGNPSASNQQNRAGTWDSNYAGVWHLKESGNPYNDSTGNNDNSTSGTYPTRVTGQIGYAQNFTSASSQYISFGDVAPLQMRTYDWTTSAWIKTSSDVEAMVSKAELADNWQMRITATGLAFLMMKQGVGSANTPDDGTVITNGVWHYVTVRVVRSDKIYRYVDGSHTGTDTSDAALNGQNISNDRKAEIGARDLIGNQNFFNGIIDEVRISKTARSTNWITTEYNNQYSPNTFLSAGTEEPWLKWNDASNPDTSSPWSWNFNFPSGTGYYQFYSIANDTVGNKEDGPSIADARCHYIYDVTTPSSSVTAISSPYWKTTSPLTISATASDTGGSGLKNVTLYYYNSSTNTTWYGPWSFGAVTNPWAGINWSFTFPKGVGYYRFYSIAVDNASNTELFSGNDTRCAYDNVVPASSIDAISPYWKTATATITATASDATSGVKNVTLWYRFSSNNGSWGGWVSAGGDTASPWSWSYSFSNGTGYYQFYSIARDNATNVESAPGSADASCGYDTVAPTSSVNALSPYWKTATITITATASDATSGMKNVTLWYRFSSNNASWGGWASAGVVSGSPWSWSFSFSNGTGYYQFYSIARDNATNVESAPGSADAICGFDNVAPTSSVNTISPYWKMSAPQTLTGTASDTGPSGLKNATLWYRYRATNASAWGGWVSPDLIDTDPWVAVSWSFTFPNGTGHYQFYSLARDNATNMESAPGGADASCGYDNMAPTSSVDAISPYWKIASPQTLTGTASDTGPDGLKNVTLWYRYRTSNTSIWGGWVSSGLVDTDPWVAVSWSFTFPNGTGNYQFYSIAKDNATNTESVPGVADAQCGYDNVAPSSSVNAISSYWQKASPLTITATATDATSGVKNVTLWFRFSSNNASWGGWVSAGVDTASPWSWSFSFSNGTGYYLFYSIAIDNATNAESAPGSKDAQCGYDNVAPTSSVTTISPYWKTSFPFTITGTASDTGGSGLKNVTLWYRYRATNASGWGGWLKWPDRKGKNPVTTPWLGISWVFDCPNGTGHYQFYSIAADNATNAESAPGSADAWCGYDNAAPTSSVDAISPYWKKTSPLTVTATASDALSGVKNVTLYYRFSSNNASWGGWVSAGVDSASPWSWSFSFSNGTGYYQFYSIAKDYATNVESSPGGAGGNPYDTISGYDNVAPTSSVNAISPYWQKASPLTITATASDALSGVKNVTLWYRFSSNNASWGGWVSAGVDSASPWSWSFSFPNGTGYYQFYSIARDYATNVESAPSDPIGPFDTVSGYDNVAPTSSVNAISPYWQKTSPLTITATASDALSGVKNVTLYYRFSSNNASWGGWVSAGVDTASPWSWSFAFLNGTGYYQFYSIAKDNAMNVESAPVGFIPYDTISGYDNVAPASSADAISPYWKKAATTITATASDATSGVKNVTLYYRFSSDNGTWGGWVNGGVDTASPWSWSFTFTNGTGYYQFYSIAKDYATNSESAPGSADALCGYDNAAPASSVSTITPYLQLRSPLSISATASDNGPSGLKNVTLKYRYSLANSSWGGWVSFGIHTTPWSGVSWSFSFSNGSGYYEFYSIASDNATNQESAPGSADARCRYLPVSDPTVVTNASTGVEETNATLHGYLQNDGGENCTVRFQYGTTTSYGTNTTNQTKSTGITFRQNVTGLTPGQLYHFRAYANNTAGGSTGNDATFLMKPNPPTSLLAQTNTSTKIYLTWTKGAGANTTQVQRKIGGYPSSVMDGTTVYNLSGTQVENMGLSPGTTYYYRAWSYNAWDGLHQWSDIYASANATTKNVPELSDEIPANGSVNVILNTSLSLHVSHRSGYQMNITWYWGLDSGCPSFIGRNTTVTNGTYTIRNDGNFSSNSQTYYWRVTVNDGHGEWTNATYHFSSIPPNKHIISKGRDAYALEMNPAGTILYGYINGNSVQTSIDTSWHYVSLTFDGSHIKLYEDGVLRNTTDLSGSINLNANDLLLGEYLSGKLDEVRVSGTARSAAWINTTYLDTSSPTTFATFGSSVGVLSTWAYRKKITMNHTLVSATLSNFPVLVFNTSDVNLQTSALSTGNDILFMSSTEDWITGTWRDKLDFEIEKFDHTTGGLEAWVRIPTLSASGDTDIYMYYGSTLCNTNRQNPTGVWDSYYCGVWHLKETGTGAVGEYVDSTTKDNDGRGGTGNTSRIPTFTSSGRVDGANAFDGVDDYIDASGRPTLNITGSLTLEAWIHPDLVTSHRRIMQFSSNNTSPAKGYLMEIQGGQLHALLGLKGGTTSEILTSTIPTSSWTYLAVTWNTSVLKGFINGNFMTNSSPNANDIDNPNTLFRIGSDTTNTSYFDGILDEVRISNTPRNAAWINTTFNTINKSNNFLRFEKQMMKNVAPTQGTPSPSNGAIQQNLNPTLRITVNDTNQDAMNVTFRTNASGSWATLGTNTSVTNGSYQQQPSTMNYPGVTYYWSVNVTDGLLWKNATYHFTTVPEVTFDATASDGCIQNTSGSYATAHDAAGGIVSSFATDLYIGQAFNPPYSVYRGFVFFDTSSIPDSASITTAWLSLYGDVDTSDQDFYLTVQNGVPTNPHDPLNSYDYYHGNYSGNGGSFNTSGFYISGYNNITLNATGRSWINKTGMTKLCLRSNRDIINMPPTMNEFIQIYASEKGNGFIPRLIVVYSK